MGRIIALCLLVSGCAQTLSCNEIINPPFGERLAVGVELRKDGPASQKWLEQYVSVLEACGYK
jgi:hypothetical protein